MSSPASHTSLLDLPFDIQEIIAVVVDSIADDQTVFSYMLVCKGIFNLLETRYPHTIFFYKRRNRSLSYQQNYFTVLMKSKPLGYFQSRVKAIYFEHDMRMAYPFLTVDFSTFRDIRHISFGVRLDESWIDKNAAIQAVLTPPLESLWLWNSSFIQFAEVFISDKLHLSERQGRRSYPALDTLTHLCIGPWFINEYNDRVLPKVKVVVSAFTSVSHLAVNSGQHFLVADSEFFYFMQWLNDQPQYHLVAILNEYWPVSSLAQQAGEKVVVLRLRQNKTLWKHSVKHLNDWRGLWGKAEDAKQKKENPLPVPDFTVDWLLNMDL
ncbi:hypothetical protein DL96DRAFT_1716437 [Flagelloscypha sp. PMI_526]|nr:hypothetical protein DL96DRAFT_1716437 [Flagelloscypha sp. PMI_526]